MILRIISWHWLQISRNNRSLARARVRDEAEPGDVYLKLKSHSPIRSDKRKLKKCAFFTAQRKSKNLRYKNPNRKINTVLCLRFDDKQSISETKSRIKKNIIIISFDVSNQMLQILIDGDECVPPYLPLNYFLSFLNYFYYLDNVFCLWEYTGKLYTSTPPFHFSFKRCPHDLLVCIGTKPDPGAGGPSRFILHVYVQRKLAATCDCGHFSFS